MTGEQANVFINHLLKDRLVNIPESNYKVNLINKNQDIERIPCGYSLAVLNENHQED